MGELAVATNAGPDGQTVTAYGVLAVSVCERTDMQDVRVIVRWRC